MGSNGVRTEGGMSGEGVIGGGGGREDSALEFRTLYYLMKFILIDDVGASFFGKDPGQLGYPIP